MIEPGNERWNGCCLASLLTGILTWVSISILFILQMETVPREGYEAAAIYVWLIIVVGLIFSISTVGLAIYGLKQIRKEKQGRGKGIGITGLVLGVLPFIVITFCFVAQAVLRDLFR